MPRRSRSDELDRAVEELVRDPDAALSATNAELSELLRVGMELRRLPRAGFRARLARELRPPIAPQDLRQAARELPEHAKGELFQRLASLDRATIGLSRFSGSGPWERHPEGDELILVLEGGGEITVLAETGRIEATLRPGMLFVCPKGLWHRPVATPTMTALYVTPLAGSEHSWADDPRASSEAP